MNQFSSPNPYAAPQAPPGQAGYAPGPFAAQAGTAHVEGTLLVAANGSALPAMCLKCGAQPTHWRAQRYQYTPPWAFLCLGWLGIVLFSKRSSFQVPLCEAHRAAWKKWNLLAGLSWLPGALLWVLGGVLVDADGGVGGILILAGTVLFFVGLFTALIVRSRRIVMPTKIDNTQSWLRGVHPSVLQAVASPPVAPGYAPYPGYPG